MKPTSRLAALALCALAVGCGRSDGGKRAAVPRIAQNGGVQTVPAWSNGSVLPGGNQLIQREPKVSVEPSGSVAVTYMDVTSQLGDLVTVRSIDAGDTWTVAGRLVGPYKDPDHVLTADGVQIRAAKVDGESRRSVIALPGRDPIVGEAVEPELFVTIHDSVLGVRYDLWNSEPPYNLHFDTQDSQGNITPRILNDSRSHFGHMVRTSAGTLLVVWMEMAGQGVWELRLARSEDGGGTFEKSVLATGGDPISRPQLFADAGGRTHLLWYERESGSLAVRYARSRDDGRSFPTKETVASGLPEHEWLSEYNGLAADGRFVYAAYNDSRGGNATVRVRFARRPND